MFLWRPMKIFITFQRTLINLLGSVPSPTILESIWISVHTQTNVNHDSKFHFHRSSWNGKNHTQTMFTKQTFHWVHHNLLFEIFFVKWKGCYLIIVHLVCWQTTCTEKFVLCVFWFTQWISVYCVWLLSHESRIIQEDAYSSWSTELWNANWSDHPNFPNFPDWFVWKQYDL